MSVEKLISAPVSCVLCELTSRQGFGRKGESLGPSWSPLIHRSSPGVALFVLVQMQSLLI